MHDRITNCLLTYAEGAVPDLFSPATGTTQLLTPYTFRAYSNAYLGISAVDDHVYLLPAGASVPLDEGPLTIYLAPSGCH